MLLECGYKVDPSKAPHKLADIPLSLAKATGPKITLDAYCGDEIGDQGTMSTHGRLFVAAPEQRIGKDN